MCYCYLECYYGMCWTKCESMFTLYVSEQGKDYLELDSRNSVDKVLQNFKKVQRYGWLASVKIRRDYMHTELMLYRSCGQPPSKGTTNFGNFAGPLRTWNLLNTPIYENGTIRTC